jgi:hypothetical protein
MGGEIEDQGERVHLGGDFLLAVGVVADGAEEFRAGDEADGFAGEGVDRFDAAVVEDGEIAQGADVDGRRG